MSPLDGVSPTGDAPLLASRVNDGVCDCGRGIWDPDCDLVDFASPELNASAFNCPSDGRRYLCYQETRRCFTAGAGFRPLVEW